jgi:hypothetical protein
MNAHLKKLLFSSPYQWSSDEPLVRWGRGGPDWTIGLSFEGTMHTGASGSGKTSGGMRAQTVAAAVAGYGILCLTTKGTPPSDVDLFVQIAKESGREHSLVFVGPGHQLGFNILRAEMSAAGSRGTRGDLSANVAALVSAALELVSPRRSGHGAETIWKQSVESAVRHAVTLVYSATGDVRLDDIVEVVKEAPQSINQSKDPTWLRESSCARFLDQAMQRRPADRNVALARSYFLEEFPLYPPETRNSVLFTFSAGCTDLFQREPLYSMFFAATDYTPAILLDGAIIVVDCPVLEFREVGQLANGILRICTQRMLDRRGTHAGERPVLIAWDECQKTLLPSDVSWQETARSARCAVVAATQHIPSVRDVVGQDLTASFFGNLRTKLFFQNSEPETCDYARRLCGQKEVPRESKNRGADGRSNVTVTPVMEDVLPAHALHDLRTGGKPHWYRVTGFLVVGSKKLWRGEPFRKILIHQRKLWGWWFSRRARVVARRRPAPDFRYLRKEKR